MHRKTIIQRYIDALGAHTYLEIGVQRGHLFLEIDAPRKIAVDPNFMISKTNRVKHLLSRYKERYYEQTSDDFFTDHAADLFEKKAIDVAFIDGLHTYQQVMRDVRNCLEYLSPGGVILLHDCLPDNEEAGLYALSPDDARDRYPGFASDAWTGDVYKAIVELRATRTDKHVFVFDTDHGVGCIQPGNMEAAPHISKSAIEAMTFAQLNENLGSYLNLKAPTYLKTAVNLAVAQQPASVAS